MVQQTTKWINSRATTIRRSYAAAARGSSALPVTNAAPSQSSGAPSPSRVRPLRVFRSSRLRPRPARPQKDPSLASRRGIGLELRQQCGVFMCQERDARSVCLRCFSVGVFWHRYYRYRDGPDAISVP
ncbi:hypothetical protein MRX96_041996 [Rhipicephalus microplus]